MWRATARALVELGSAAFFVAGVAWSSVGAPAPWFVLGVVALSAAFRAADVEARALFVPGGLYGSVKETLGGSAAKVGASALLPHGYLGIWAAIPFAIWFFLAVEGVPLAA